MTKEKHINILQSGSVDVFDPASDLYLATPVFWTQFLPSPDDKNYVDDGNYDEEDDSYNNNNHKPIKASTTKTTMTKTTTIRKQISRYHPPTKGIKKTPN